MKHHILALAAMLAWAHPACALDNTASVKVTPLLKTSTSWDGKPLVYPAGQAEVTALIVEIAAGGQTGWHEHSVPSFAYVLEGTLEVTQGNGATCQLHVGDTLPEVVQTLHNGRALGDKPVRLFVLYTGTVNQPLTSAHPEFTPPAPVQSTSASPGNAR
jgi:quercetin dioxygenase-like cupin family protein